MSFLNTLMIYFIIGGITILVGLILPNNDEAKRIRQEWIDSGSYVILMITFWLFWPLLLMTYVYLKVNIKNKEE